MRASLAVVIALPVAAGCGPATIEAEEESSAVCGTGGPGQTSREAFAQAMGEMSGEFGTDGDTAVPEECLGKADWLSVPDPCELLAPLIPFGDDVLRPGLVAGVEGQGVLGVSVAVGGYDLVFDLYNQQMTISKYAGAGLGLPGAGGSVTAYAGAAFGFEESVAEWNGYFVTASGEVSMPFLRDYVSLNPAVYVSGVDDDGDGVVAPDEVLAPPDGIYGFNIGASVGLDVLPDALPVGGSVTEGLWTQHKDAVRSYYDELADTNLLGWFGSLEVRLLDAETNEPCPADWPEEASSKTCVIQFGHPAEDPFGSAKHLAYGICHVTGSCAIPLTWAGSATALAIGALRDSGLSFSNLCGEPQQYIEPGEHTAFAPPPAGVTQ